MTRFERRRAERVETAGSAVVEREGRRSFYRVQNLSSGGGLLVGTDPIPSGERVRLRVTALAIHIPCSGRAVWTEERGPSERRIGVAFAELTEEQASAVRAAVAGARRGLEEETRSLFMILDSPGRRRDALERRLLSLGHRVLATPTPLGAIAHLVGGAVTAAIVGDAVGTAGAAEMLAYLAEAHPEVRRVLLRDPDSLAELGGAERALAHQVLPVPWSDLDIEAIATSPKEEEP